MVAATTFELLAAIDLRGGRVVRLRQGDFDRETSYGTDPVAVARSLVDQGAACLHVVDLDGARAGDSVQAPLIDAIVRAVGDVKVEVAGGLRSVAAVERAFAGGASRVVLGTAALRDPAFAGEVVARFGPDRVAVALDLRDGRPVVDGWLASSGIADAARAIHRTHDVGVTMVEVTAIDRDGTLEGPDLELLARLVALDRGWIIASGGVTTIDDIRAVRDLGCAGAIVGRAIYEGVLDLRTAIDTIAAPGALTQNGGWSTSGGSQATHGGTKRATPHGRRPTPSA